jgi:predicted enzyme related to lactoylglutathione lyase
MIRQLKFASIPTRDQDAGLAFWAQKVGFQIATDQPMGPGQRWIELSIPSTQTGIVLFTAPGQEDRLGTFFNGSFACDDVDHSYQQMLAGGWNLSIRRPSSAGGRLRSSRPRGQCLLRA